MKARVASLALGLGLLVLFQVPIGLSQQPEASDSGEWMLEIMRGNRAPEYQEMSHGDEEASSGFNELDWQPDWNRADKTLPQPSSLEFYYRMQGTAVTVRVLLAFDPSESKSGSGEKLTVGTFVLHPGESITVPQLSRYGLQPVEMKLVSAKPPEAIQPEIINKTPSMVVEKVDQDRAEYKLFLRNASELAVDAVVVSVLDGDGRCKMHNLHAWSGHYIPPGATQKLHLSLPIACEDEGVVGTDGESCSNAAQGVRGSSPDINSTGDRTPKIVIETIDFEDGSNEGDDRKAAMLEAERLGREIGRARINAVVEKQLASTQPDGMDKLVSVRSQVLALPDNVDPGALESIMARFPTEPESEKKSIEKDIKEGMLMGKVTFLGMLRLYLFELTKQLASDPSLQKWWDATKGQRDWLASPGVARNQ